MVWFALITTHSLAAGSGQSFDIVRLDYGPLQGPYQTLGSFERVDGRRWIETTVTNALFRYEEVDRTARAVYLYDRSRNVEVELNLSTRTIFYTTPHDTRRALFRIGQEQFAQARAAPRDCRRAVQGQIAWIIRVSVAGTRKTCASYALARATPNRLIVLTRSCMAVCSGAAALNGNGATHCHCAPAPLTRAGPSDASSKSWNSPTTGGRQSTVAASANRGKRQARLVSTCSLCQRPGQREIA